MKNFVIVLSALSLVAVCGKSGEPSESGPGPSKGGTKAAPKPLTELFAGKGKVTLVGPLAKIGLGWEKTKVGQTVPGFVEDLGEVKSDEFAGVTFSVYFKGDRKIVESASINLPKADARAAITKAWGEPLEAQDRGKPTLSWFNPEEGLRAVLKEGAGGPETQTLWLGRYLPASKLIGNAKDRLGFETTPLLGATLQAIQQAYPHEWGEPTGDSAYLELPGTELAARTQVKATAETGKIVKYQFNLGFAKNAKHKAALLALFEAKCGKATEAKSATGSAQLNFCTSPTFHIREDTAGSSWFVEVTP